jgi:hypothetical protein
VFTRHCRELARDRHEAVQIAEADRALADRPLSKTTLGDRSQGRWCTGANSAL